MARKILLADDSVTIQKVVELTFMDQDCDVTSVGDGDAALASLRARRPDLVIADVHMPGADGYAVCRVAKSTYPGLPVLLLVGTFEAFEEADVVACGADGHLRKPFEGSMLLAEAERLLAAAAAAPALAAPTAAEALSTIDDSWAVADAAVDVEPIAESWDSFAEAEPESVVSEPPVLAPAGSPWEAPAVVAAPEVMAASVVAPRGPAFWPEPAEADAPVVPAAVFQPAVSQPVFQPAAPEPVAAAVAYEDVTESAVDTSSAEEELVERIARRVVELMSEKLVRQVAWDVIPDLAEVVIRDRIRELEAELEG